jgi:hypothetical protein
MPIGLDEPYRVFISEDPIGLKGGINKFVYAGNNPVNFIDPLGLKENECDECDDGDCEVWCLCDATTFFCMCYQRDCKGFRYIGLYLIARRNCGFICKFGCENFPPGVSGGL